VDDLPVGRLLFFVAPSPRAHLDLLGRLSKLITREPFRELVEKGAADEEIFKTVQAFDATLGGPSEPKAKS
jgi:PTS system nitrogen regulatory IIA component